jgi:hypothetical protein
MRQNPLQVEQLSAVDLVRVYVLNPIGVAVKEAVVAAEEVVGEAKANLSLDSLN